MNINLTSGELVVLAEQLELDAGFAVGQRSDAELATLREEGWRSLLARDLARVGEESVMLSSELESVAADVLAPMGLVVHTRAEGETAAVSTILVGTGRMLEAVPLANDVVAFASTDAERVVSAIVSSVEATDSAGVYRLDAFSRAGDRPESAVTWVVGPDGRLFDMDGDTASETSLDEIRQGVSDVVSIASSGEVVAGSS